MKEAKINSIPELFFWAASEFMEEKLFNEAADKIVTIIKAFEFETSLYESFTEKMDELTYKDFDEFISELFERIKISKKAAQYFSKPEQLEALSHFASFVSNHLKKKAEIYKEQDKLEEAIKCLEEVLELRPGDEEIEQQIERYKNLSEKSRKPKIFRLVLDGTEQTYEWDWRERTVDLEYEESLILLSETGAMLSEARAIEASGDYYDRVQDEVLYRDDDCVISLKRGRYEDKLVFNPRKP